MRALASREHERRATFAPITGYAGPHRSSIGAVRPRCGSNHTPNAEAQPMPAMAARSAPPALEASRSATYSVRNGARPSNAPTTVPHANPSTTWTRAAILQRWPWRCISAQKVDDGDQSQGASNARDNDADLRVWNSPAVALGQRDSRSRAGRGDMIRELIRVVARAEVGVIMRDAA